MSNIVAFCFIFQRLLCYEHEWCVYFSRMFCLILCNKKKVFSSHAHIHQKNIFDTTNERIFCHHVLFVGNGHIEYCSYNNINNTTQMQNIRNIKSGFQSIRREREKENDDEHKFSLLFRSLFVEFFCFRYYIFPYLSCRCDVISAVDYDFVQRIMIFLSFKNYPDTFGAIKTIQIVF